MRHLKANKFGWVYFFDFKYLYRVKMFVSKFLKVLYMISSSKVFTIPEVLDRRCISLMQSRITGFTFLKSVYMRVFGIACCCLADYLIYYDRSYIFGVVAGYIFVELISSFLSKTR